ncbi:MAG TPA: HAMP domain-containing sensor histidine kinase [Candidatus Methylomirabilis sp.]|nr:HAMP domain-containing sensor histidine kinase [Candidatus Methylomirabilis sp.]
MLRLDLAYMAADPAGSGPLEKVRVRGRLDRGGRGCEIAGLLAGVTTDSDGHQLVVLPDPATGEPLRATRIAPALAGHTGVVIAASRRSDFPTPFERFLLQSVVTQAEVAIRNAALMTALHDALEREQVARAEAEAANRAKDLLNEELEDKRRQLELASQHKSEFLANMSHELRTPLNAVIGFSEVLLDRLFGEVNDKQAEYLRDILSSGQHLLSLINDILDLSKIEAGRMELALAPFHLPQALENALILVKERAARHGIGLKVGIDPGLGELVGDERKTKQVLLNLLSNAVKFTPEGGQINLTARLRDGVVEISVSDTGIGIAPEDQEMVFEEFRQVGRDEARKQEGTGLGLTLSKKFVEMHGGRIWVESAVGRGSTFTFTLPVGPVAPSA